MRSALWYSITASPYCCCVKYRSARSRWRAFLASGYRLHPAARTIPHTSSRTVIRGELRDTGRTSQHSVGQVVAKDRVHRLDVGDEELRGLADVSVDRAHDPHNGSVSAVAHKRALDHRDPRGDFPGDRVPLGLIPIQDDPLLPLLLDQVPIHDDERVASRERNRDERGFYGLPAGPGKAVLRRVNHRPLALRVPVADVEVQASPG